MRYLLRSQKIYVTRLSTRMHWIPMERFVSKKCLQVTFWIYINISTFQHITPPNEFEQKAIYSKGNSPNLKWMFLGPQITENWKSDMLNSWESKSFNSPLFCSTPLLLHSGISWQKSNKLMLHLYTQVILQQNSGLTLQGVSKRMDPLNQFATFFPFY